MLIQNPIKNIWSYFKQNKNYILYEMTLFKKQLPKFQVGNCLRLSTFHQAGIQFGHDGGSLSVTAALSARSRKAPEPASAD